MKRDPKEVVRQNILAYTEVANALIKIRDEELWQKGYVSFHDYLASQFNDPQQVLRLLAEYEGTSK